MPFYDPDGVLIDWKDRRGWTLTDALAGTLVTGSTGSGKSSGPGAMLRRAFLKDTDALPGGMGGIVFFAKNGEADDWVKAARLSGRGDDIIRVTADGRCKFNYLDWIAKWGIADGDTRRGPIATVALLEEIRSGVSAKGSGAGDKENAFFEGALHEKLIYLVLVIQLCGLPVTLPLMRAIASSEPQTVAQVKEEAWRRDSVCWHILREAYHQTEGDNQARKDWAECKRYFLTLYPSLSFRTRGVVEIMFSALVQPFLTRPLRPIFCEGTNVTPEMCFDGKILLIDIPVQEYHQTARLAALAFKRCFQLAVMRRSGPPGTLRPCFRFCDESQEFLSPKDEQYQSVARSSGGVTCLLTQQISSIRQALGNQDKAENLTSNLQTKFFCQNTGETARWASALIGERYTNVSTFSWGRDKPSHPDDADRGSSSSGVNSQDDLRAYIEPIKFQQLRRGGEANGYEVDAVVFAGGKMFKGDKEMVPFKALCFDQKEKP